MTLKPTKQEFIEFNVGGLIAGEGCAGGVAGDLRAELRLYLSRIGTVDGDCGVAGSEVPGMGRYWKGI